jgi:hypothetical protein
MKKAFGPSAIKTIPLESDTDNVIKDHYKQMKRWGEHNQELYSRWTTISNMVLEKTLQLSIMDKLNAPPTIEELEKAINFLSSGKTAATTFTLYCQNCKQELALGTPLRAPATVLGGRSSATEHVQS